MQMLNNSPTNLAIQVVSENRLVCLFSPPHSLANFQWHSAMKTAETQICRWLSNLNGALSAENILVNREIRKQEKCSPAYHRGGIQCLVLSGMILETWLSVFSCKSEDLSQVMLRSGGITLLTNWPAPNSHNCKLRFIETELPLCHQS